MRLQYYINEGIDKGIFIESLTLIYDKCYPFIKELLQYKFKPNDDLLYSGRDKTADYFKGRVRSDRKPRDINEEIQELFDKEFYKRFKVRFRSNSIFCTGDYEQASSYGSNVYAIFPIGKYKYAWSPVVYDLFTDIVDNPKYDDYINDDISDPMAIDNAIDNKIDDMYNEYLRNYDQDEDDYIEYDDFKDEHIDAIIDEVTDELLDNLKYEVESEVSEIVDTYKDNKLKDAIISHNEIMVNCKEYIGIHEQWFDYLKQYFSVYGNKKPTKEIIEDIRNW